MISTGIVRRLDDLGRIVLPVELRRSMGLRVKDALEIFVSGSDTVILRKYVPACVFCGEADDVIAFRRKNICPDCLDALVSLRRERREENCQP